MSHDIDDSTGKPAMAFVGAAPWHGLGANLPQGQSIEVWKQAAGLDWTIQMVPVQYQFDGKSRTMPERFVLTRDDTGGVLSVVSGDYQVVQPAEVLEFYRDLVAERHYTLETAGALDGGRKVWAMAKTGMVANVSGNAADQLGAYVLLATSCDKSLATTVSFTSVRVVCQNTLGFAFNDMSLNQRKSIKVEHTKKFDHRDAKESLGLIDDAWSNFLDRVNPMASLPLTDSLAQGYFESLFLPVNALVEKPISLAKRREVHQIMSLYKSAHGQDIATAKGTLWGAVNAVTYYTDHVRSTRSAERIDSAWFGSGAALKSLAWIRAEELMEQSAVR
jgi:phage/plasmid-like protein (TIGR03299 family)